MLHRGDKLFINLQLNHHKHPSIVVFTLSTIPSSWPCGFYIHTTKNSYWQINIVSDNRFSGNPQKASYPDTKVNTCRCLRLIQQWQVCFGWTYKQLWVIAEPTKIWVIVDLKEIIWMDHCRSKGTKMGHCRSKWNDVCYHHTYTVSWWYHQMNTLSA